MGRTIESPSNQLRIMNEQWERLSRAVGNVFLPILSKILPYLNAILMVLTEIISAIASLLGYDSEDFDYFENTTTSVKNLDDGIKGASASAKKLKQGLRGFDKLNVITTPSSGGGGAGGGAGATGINPKLMDAFNKAFDDYQNKLSNVQMKATKIRDAIMEWLGFTKVIDEETGKVSFKFDHITGGTVLGALAIGGTIFLGISRIFRIFKGITGLSFAKTLGKVGTKTGAGASGLLGILGTLTLLTADVFLIKIAVDGYKEVVPIAEDLKERTQAIKNAIQSSNAEWTKNTNELVENAKAGKLSTEQNQKLADGLLNNIKNTEILTKDMEKNKNTGNLVVDMWNYFNGTTGKVVQSLRTLNEEQKHDTELLVSMYKAGLLNEEQRKKLEEIYNKQIETLKNERKNVRENSYDYKLYTKQINELENALNDMKGNYDSKVTIKGEIIQPKDKIKLDVDTSKAKSSTSSFWNKLGDAFKKTFNMSINALHFANGGLPPAGQLFVANEKGPELVGQIGGQSFVANQNQMMDLLDKKLGNAQSNNSTQVYNIYLDKNTKLATYVIDQLQDMAKTNGKPIEIGG